MTDPLNDLREPITPVDPDPAFAAELRSRLERALLAPEGVAMTATTDVTASTAVVTEHTLGSYLAVTDARRALEFYEQAFGAQRRGEPYVMDDGRIGHAEMAIGDSVLMLADEFPEIGMLSPLSRGGPSQSLYLRVATPDAVDATVRVAVDSGARLERAAADYDYGRNAVLVDLSGHRWMVASAPAEVTEEPASAPEPAPGGAPRHGDLAYLTHTVVDSARAQAFYGAVLGWRFSSGSVEDGWQIEGTSPPTGMRGGAPQPALEPVYRVDDLQVALAAVRDHGGHAGEPQQHPYGRLANCTDDQGVGFALLEITLTK